MTGAAVSSLVSPTAKRCLALYIALLILILASSAAGIYSYFATYPLLRSTAVRVVWLGFWGLPVTTPIVFGLAFLLPKQDVIATAKVHASLCTTYALILAYKLGSADQLFVSLLYAFLSIELLLLGGLLLRAPKSERNLDGAPWLFSALTFALLAGAVCGALTWQAAVRAEMMKVTLAKGQNAVARMERSEIRDSFVRG